MLARWFEETKINRPTGEIAFGQYRIYLDDGIILMKNLAKGQIDIINHTRLGLRDSLSKNGRLLLSEILEKGKNAGNAGFFVLDAGYEKAVYVSMAYGTEEVRMTTTDYNLGFGLSDDYDASAREGSLIVIDRKAQRYRLVKADGSTLSASLRLEPDSSCFLVSRDIGVITNPEAVYVVHEGLRDLIEIRKLNEKNGSALLKPEIGAGFAEEQWLAVKDEKWKKECLLVALGGKEKFGYAFCSLTHPFENEEGSEGLRR